MESPIAGEGEVNRALQEIQQEAREGPTSPLDGHPGEPTIIDATPTDQPREKPTGVLGEGGSQQEDNCRCPPPPPGDKARNLIVCIDGTANQFGLKVSSTVISVQHWR